ncbi:dual specificity protein phosphatase [Protomyces lactucae-debilis]|uniref:protein-tyrosine-phosphatase n=1 Tax=Protomyces lactucae-debilis TaxID=2754530 RepID=A0A1Y2F085_PROLT|nr:dual specificity protein phosphatase [Protomyces lactucae-debilis]ORY76385.1 dual specificity protein phosphatase [Protomyces lactucae-debilis]
MSPPMIEFLQDRLYLSAFDAPPSKEKHPHLRFFTVDDLLVYHAFHMDFGPLHIGHLYRFAIILHEILSDPDMSAKPIVFYSRTDARSRANAACLLACYMVLVQNWPPHLAIAPLAQSEPPFMAFRDAGYSQADFCLSIQDFVYGLWRAKEAEIIDIKTFDLEEYEYYELVDKGDFNWVCPRFIAFASPVQSGYTTKANPFKKAQAVSATFQHVLDYFSSHSVGMVFRLNSHLYDKSHFEKQEIEHIDMFFEDGTCPELDVVKTFIGLTEEMAEQDKVVAVHCKAGLGRTGCLIGAYLIYKHRFTANEVIAYMRIMRPGMVVGPQQHWLHINQHHFTEWSYTGAIKKRQPQSAVFCTPPRPVLGSLDDNTTEARVFEKGERAEMLPAPTPGQPRKAPMGRLQVVNNENTVDELAEPTDKISPRQASGRYGELGKAVAGRIASRESPRRKVSRDVAVTPRSVSTSSTVGGGVRKSSGKQKRL